MNRFSTPHFSSLTEKCFLISAEWRFVVPVTMTVTLSISNMTHRGLKVFLWADDSSSFEQVEVFVNAGDLFVARDEILSQSLIDPLTERIVHVSQQDAGGFVMGVFCKCGDCWHIVCVEHLSTLEKAVRLCIPATALNSTRRVGADAGHPRGSVLRTERAPEGC